MFIYLRGVNLDTKLSDSVLVAQAKSGNSDSLNQIIKKYSDFVMCKACSFKNLNGLESDDLYQEGMLGLLSAVYSFDENRQVSFSAYASTLVVRKMISAVKASNSKANLPMQSYLSIDDFGNALLNYSTPEHQLIYNEDINSAIRFANENLSKTEKKVLKLSLVGMSYKEIADILDSSVKSVDNAMQRIRKKFKTCKRD